MKISVIGAGNMGGAIGMGLLKNGTDPSELTMCNDVEDKLKPFAARGTAVTTDVKKAVSGAEMVIIALKPNVFESVLPLMTDNKDAIFVSIAAGVSIGFIKRYLGNIKIVRVMPNTPAMLGKGMTAICSEAPVTETDLQRVESVLGAVGSTERVDETQMDAIVSLNGSSPAYVYMLIEAMVKFGTENGIDEQKSLRLACKSLVGAAEMALASDEPPSVLAQRVCSPGGTTIEAVKKLNEYRFEEGVVEAMNACTNRSRELTK